ncbi:response regulator transcription factor [Aquimarina sp. U1-2]|uniref:LytR/AlgR family response regulator transcription factor n=1 Tax=Aquimarina sp. U1-2 TaxID=2823141 RepID=UPI001AED0617|nr:LytTR family DNA-binding domain-containing protein [Aquimarina sp. U1-2]MBP2832091.1 response regulator transcription factor [Aquimarina sp. U1-2]
MKKPLIKCGVVEDSQLQRRTVINLIKKHPNLELIGAWNNAIEAKNGLLDIEIDVLFLDIEMPILNGFHLLDNLECQPHVIIVTGKSKYAQKAFDYQAVDFLKKPLKSNRFSIAIDKLLKLHFHNTNIETEKSAPSIFIKSGVKQYKVYLQDILYVSAMGDFAKIHFEKDSPLIVAGTMTYLESLLPEQQFFRIHRSFIVNLEKIERFTTRYLEIKNEVIPISRQKRRELKNVLY